jgi:hypothetical protein
MHYLAERSCRVRGRSRSTLAANGKPRKLDVWPANRRSHGELAAGQAAAVGYRICSGYAAPTHWNCGRALWRNLPFSRTAVSAPMSTSRCAHFPDLPRESGLRLQSRFRLAGMVPHVALGARPRPARTGLVPHGWCRTGLQSCSLPRADSPAACCTPAELPIFRRICESRRVHHGPAERPVQRVGSCWSPGSSPRFQGCR